MELGGGRVRGRCIYFVWECFCRCGCVMFSGVFLLVCVACSTCSGWGLIVGSFCVLLTRFFSAYLLRCFCVYLKGVGRVGGSGTCRGVSLNSLRI